MRCVRTAGGLAVVVSASMGCSFQIGSGGAPRDGDPDGRDPDAPVHDAAVLPDAFQFDASPATCFGPASGALRICLPTLPTQPLVVPASVDTDACPGGFVIDPSPAAPDVCVLAGTTATISGTVTAIGTRPLVLLATGAMVVGPSATIDVSSYRNGQRGAGANHTGCPEGGAPGSSANGGGGGAGGSHQTRGGNGGAGGGGAAGTAGATGTQPFLRGGCRGANGGAGSSAGGAGGDAGGALYVLSAGALEIHGKLRASGAGGVGAAAGKGGGGGGGSGGMIALYGAPLSVTAGAQIWANGGGGGGGAASSASGSDGSESFTPTSPANFGTGGSGGGTGGNGGGGAIATQPGGTGQTGDRGGGGGGGGVGVIDNAGGVGITGGAISPPAF